MSLGSSLAVQCFGLLAVTAEGLFFPKKKKNYFIEIELIYNVVLISMYILNKYLIFVVDIAVSSLSHVQLSVTLWTVAHQAPLSMEFPRQEY